MADTTGSSFIEKKAVSHGTLGTVLALQRVVLSCTAAILVLCVFLGYTLFLNQGYATRKPWVAGLDSNGDLKTYTLNPYEVTPDVVFQFLSFAIPRLYYVDHDRQPGIDSVRLLIADAIVGPNVAKFESHKQYFADQDYVFQASVNRINPGAPGARAFLISKKRGFVLCMIEGRLSVTSRVRNVSDPIRWDCELEIIQPTEANRWGLRVVQLHESSVNDAPISIPPSYFDN